MGGGKHLLTVCVVTSATKASVKSSSFREIDTVKDPMGQIIQFDIISTDVAITINGAFLYGLVWKLQPWELKRRQEDSVRVNENSNGLLKHSQRKSASMWIVWGCNHGVLLHRQRSASRPRGKVSTTWCHQRRPGMTHGPQTREVHRNFNKIPLQKEPINSILLPWRNKSTARKGTQHPTSKTVGGITPLDHFLSSNANNTK